MPEEYEPNRPFALNGIASVQSRYGLGGLWSSEATMKVRLGFDPDEPAEVSFRVGDTSWLFDRELIELALCNKATPFGAGDVITQIGVSGMFRITLLGQDQGTGEDSEALVQLPIATVQMFAAMMEASVPSESVEYDVDSWLEEMDQA